MKKITCSPIIIGFLTFSIGAEAQDINGVELGSLILSGFCVENEDDEFTQMNEFLQHYHNVHRYIGSECDYDTSIDISNDLSKMLSGIQSLHDSCEYNSNQLERVYLDYGVDLNSSNVKSHPNFDRAMGILYAEKPENFEYYTYYENEGAYLINEQHIECDNLNLDVIKELIELGVTNDSEIY